MQFLVEEIDNASERTDFLHVTNWSNIDSALELIHIVGTHVSGQSKLESKFSNIIILVLGQPRLEVWFPSDIRFIYEQYTTS
jgi:hypothetical protein